MAEEEITHAHAGGRVKENAPTEKLTGEGEAWQRVMVEVTNPKNRVRKRAVGRIRAVIMGLENFKLSHHCRVHE